MMNKLLLMWLVIVFSASASASAFAEGKIAKITIREYENEVRHYEFSSFNKKGHVLPLRGGHEDCVVVFASDDSYFDLMCMSAHDVRKRGPRKSPATALRYICNPGNDPAVLMFFDEGKSIGSAMVEECK